MKKICCIGHLTKDKIITPQGTAYLSGGTAYYFAYAINALPKKVAFELITKVGKDAEAVVNELQSNGIEVQSFASAHTVYFENKYGSNPNHRTQRVLDKADAFTLADMSHADADIYHIGSLLSDDFSPETICALAAKGSVSIDAQGFLRQVTGQEVQAKVWAEAPQILSCTDVLKVNEHEMEVLTGCDNPRKAGLALAAYGVKEVVMTLGSYGSVIYADRVFYDIPAFAPRKVVDVTGCGDTYMAGYLYCRAQGAGIQESGVFAAKMCTEKIERQGHY